MECCGRGDETEHTQKTPLGAGEKVNEVLTLATRACVIVLYAIVCSWVMQIYAGNN